MKDENDAFYVVRKGDIIGVYRSLSDCQGQVGSVYDPSVSVFKGYSLPKEAKECLSSQGLQNALYTVNATDVKEGLLGELVPCPFQQPPSNDDKTEKLSPSTRSLEVFESSHKCAQTSSPGAVSNNLQQIKLPTINERPQHTQKNGECTEIPDDSKNQCSKTETPPQPQRSPNLNEHLWYNIESMRYLQASCILQFGGASKGNPGPAGAGAVLRTWNGKMLCKLREGVGLATCNVAEYRGLILGLKHALKNEFRRISVQGDSNLVCMQVQGLWQTKNANMKILCKEAMELKDKFESFEIGQILRVFNSEADTQANRAVDLKNGQVEVDWEK